LGDEPWNTCYSFYRVHPKDIDSEASSHVLINFHVSNTLWTRLKNKYINRIK